MSLRDLQKGADQMRRKVNRVVCILLSGAGVVLAVVIGRHYIS